MDELPSPLAVVCHDAGGANLILPLLKAYEGSVRAVMQGPAARLWAVAFPGRALEPDLSDALRGASSLLSGTGWGSDLEHEARCEAARLGIPSVAMLDHWVNYPQRFERGAVRCWPDALWVTDSEAERMAWAAFPGVPVVRKPNRYVQEQLSRIGKAPGRGHVLYALEPVRDDWGRGVPGEFQALEYALAHLKLMVPEGDARLILRPHPSEPPGKYQDFIERHGSMTLDASIDMAQAISRADVVIGVESFALTLALQAGRKVFCTLPPWAPALRLPHEGIVQIRNLHQ